MIAFALRLLPNNNAVQVCIIISDFLIQYVIGMAGALPTVSIRWKAQCRTYRVARAGYGILAAVNPDQVAVISEDQL